MAIACAAPSPHACVSSRSVSSPQANGVVDASAFLRRAYHSSAILDRRLYIDGGEFSFSKGDGISYESSNSLISIDLDQAWVNGSVTLHSTPKPPEVPSLTYGGIWVDRKEGVLYTGFAGTTPSFGDTAPSPQGLWSFTPDGSGGGTWENLNKTADALFTDGPRPYQGQVASGRDLGFFLGGFVGDGAGGQQHHPVGNLITYDFSSGKATNSTVWDGSGLFHGWGHSGGINYVPSFGKRGILINVGGHQDHREDSDGLVDFQTVQVYDIDSQQWLEQKTSGDTPLPRKEFCIAGAPSSERTYEILVYAGWDGHFGLAAKLYDSAYVLTLPGFFWVKADYLPQHPRHGLTCNAVGGGQILAIGGVDSAEQQDGVNGISTTGFNTADPLTQGLAIFYLTGLTWSSAYSSNAGPQPPASRIQQYYKFQGRQPLNGFSNSALGAIFSTDDFSPSNPGEGGPFPPSTSSSSAAENDRHDTRTRTIVGSVLGSAAGIGALTAFTLLFRRRRRRRRHSRRSAAEGKDRVAGGAGGGEGQPALTDETAEMMARGKNVEASYGGAETATVSEGVTTLVPSPVEGTVEIDGGERLEMEVCERPGELEGEGTAVPLLVGGGQGPVEIAGEERLEMEVCERPGELEGEEVAVPQELSGEAAVLELPGSGGRPPAELPAEVP
ncbi:hypothetical protein BT67DRAFT_371835 [Trichocladium antarcticum]|uniref:Kelch repeat protein n=1 Tax=Trichocladium antarcticum TaxID=1450529 RepID=A0AAN6URN3_9PEZI|nr:hypothetical protein BT67DRAFT_371835 [Trichocladium antarcticum]